MTDWVGRSIAISTPGWYWLGFGLGEVAEGTLASILAVDNVRFQVVPEPATLALVAAALAGLGLLRRKHANG